MFHTARWDSSVKLAGKKVAMIGAGASGFQVAPEIAAEVETLVIFQRSAQWMAPNMRYRRAVGDGVKWAMRHLPGYARLVSLHAAVPGQRQGSGARAGRSRLARSAGLGERPRAGEAKSAQSRGWSSTSATIRSLFRKVLPDYPPMGKRLLQDDGSWLRCLRRENVELVRDEVTQVERHAVLTAGKRFEADVLVMATGFRAQRDGLLGRGSTAGTACSLADQWGTAPAAHLGITVPGFPNLFLMYGPGTNLAHAGSIIFHSECQMQFIGACLRSMLERESKAIEVRRHVRSLCGPAGEGARGHVWAHPSVEHSWYKGADGKVHVLSPWRLVDYWAMTKRPISTSTSSVERSSEFLD